MLRRTKGTTLAEIVEHTAWQKHSIRGFISILGSKGWGKNRILEERRQRAHLSHRQVARRGFASDARFRFAPGGVPACCEELSGRVRATYYFHLLTTRKSAVPPTY